MSSKTLKFKHDNHVTKRTFRFKEVDDQGIILDMVAAIVGTLYVKKNTFDGDVPKRLSITLDWD